MVYHCSVLLWYHYAHYLIIFLFSVPVIPRIIKYDLVIVFATDTATSSDIQVPRYSLLWPAVTNT